MRAPTLPRTCLRQGLGRTDVQPPAHRRRTGRRIEHFPTPIRRLPGCSFGTEKEFRGFQLKCLDSYFLFSRIALRLTTVFDRGCRYGWCVTFVTALDARVEYSSWNQNQWYQRTSIISGNEVADVRAPLS